MPTISQAWAQPLHGALCLSTEIFPNGIPVNLAEDIKFWDFQRRCFVRCFLVDDPALAPLQRLALTEAWDFTPLPSSIRLAFHRGEFWLPMAWCRLSYAQEVA